MSIRSESQAYHLLDDVHEAALVPEASVRYLARHPTPRALQPLTLALNDDDFGVHWEAAAALAGLGAVALYAARLIEALKGPAADIATLIEANHWLEEIESRERAVHPAVSWSTGTAPSWQSYGRL